MAQRLGSGLLLAHGHGDEVLKRKKAVGGSNSGRLASLTLVPLWLVPKTNMGAGNDSMMPDDLIGHRGRISHHGTDGCRWTVLRALKDGSDYRSRRSNDTFPGRYPKMEAIAPPETPHTRGEFKLMVALDSDASSDVNGHSLTGFLLKR
jgi:hypothetical protein